MVMRKRATLQEQEDGIIYARYSSHAQKDASIEQQIRECMAFAKAQGIRIVEVYADRAVSGKTDRRPDFQRMMRDAEKGKFRYVIAWKSNRMGRNMLQAMMNEARLNEMGIRVLYTEEDFDNTAAGRFALRSMMNVNQFYSENMAEDIRRGLNDNALQCKVNGSLPLGFVRGEDGRYALDEPKAAIVQEIFIRVACMEPFVDIANDLNARGIKTSRGKPWGKNSFHALVTNERYLGVYIYDDIRVEGGIPRIISDELFYKVQEVLKTKKNPQGRPRSYGEYLLTGKLYCGHCKSPMVGISGTARSGALHYYYSCQRHRLEKTCDKRNVRRDVIEEAVARAIQDYALQPDIIEWIADSTVEYAKKQETAFHVAVLEDELSEVKRSIKNLMAAIEQGIITDTTKSRMLELEAEQARLTAQIAAGRADIIVIPREDIIAGLTMYRDGDIKDKRYQAKLFDTFLVAVYLYDDDMKIVFSFSGKQNTVRVPLDASVVADIENPSSASGSYALPFGPPKSKTRRKACLAFLDSTLVFKYQALVNIAAVFFHGKYPNFGYTPGIGAFLYPYTSVLCLSAWDTGPRPPAIVWRWYRTAPGRSADRCFWRPAGPAGAAGIPASAGTVCDSRGNNRGSCLDREAWRSPPHNRNRACGKAMRRPLQTGPSGIWSYDTTCALFFPLLPCKDIVQYL